MRETASMQLAELQKSYAFFEFLALANPTGAVVAASKADLVDKKTLAEYTTFQGALKGDVVMADTALDAAAATPVFMVAVPVKQADQSVGGVLFGAINLFYFNQFIERMKIGQTGYAYVYAQDGLTWRIRSRS